MKLLMILLCALVLFLGTAQANIPGILRFFGILPKEPPMVVQAPPMGGYPNGYGNPYMVPCMQPGTCQ